MRDFIAPEAGSNEGIHDLIENIWKRHANRVDSDAFTWGPDSNQTWFLFFFFSFFQEKMMHFFQKEKSKASPKLETCPQG